MVGGSYHGATQWLAAAEAPPALRAIAPAITSDSYYDGWTYQGGAFELGFVLSWTLGALALAAAARDVGRGRAMAEVVNQIVEAVDHLDELFACVPLAGASVPRSLAPYYFDWLAHPTPDAFWRDLAPRENHARVVVPSLNIGGWYDCFLGGTLANYRGARLAGVATRATTRDSSSAHGPTEHGEASFRKHRSAHARMRRCFRSSTRSSASIDTCEASPTGLKTTSGEDLRDGRERLAR